MAENQYSNFDGTLVALTKESTSLGGWGLTGNSNGQYYRYPLYMLVDHIEPTRDTKMNIRKWMGAGRDPNTSWSGGQLFEVKVDGALVFDHNFGTTSVTDTSTTSTTQYCYNNFLSMLGCAMGTVNTTAECILRDTLDSFTMEWGNDPVLRDQQYTGFSPANEYYNQGTPEYFLASGCRINTYEFTLNKEGMAKVSLGIMCKHIAVSSSVTDLGGSDNLDDIYIPNIRPLDFWDGGGTTYPFQITFGDSSTYVQKVGATPEFEEISFMINNNLEPRHALGTSKDIRSLNARGREITVTAKVVKRSQDLKDVYNNAFTSGQEVDLYHANSHLDSLTMALYHTDFYTTGASNYPMMYCKFNNLIPLECSDNMGTNDDEQIIETHKYRALRTGDSRYLHPGHTANLEPMQARVGGSTTLTTFTSQPTYP